jgi:hypothetical protein
LTAVGSTQNKKTAPTLPVNMDLTTLDWFLFLFLAWLLYYRMYNDHTAIQAIAWCRCFTRRVRCDIHINLSLCYNFFHLIFSKQEHGDLTKRYKKVNAIKEWDLSVFSQHWDLNHRPLQLTISILTSSGSVTLPPPQL